MSARNDSVGMFWEDVELPSRGRSTIARERPPIPVSSWKPLKTFPNLASAKAICIDTETCDPELMESGPGWGRKDKGHVVGVSVGVEDAQWYFPVRHIVQPELNLDQVKVVAWLRETLGDAAQPKVFANSLYDIGWLHDMGVTDIRGDIIDVQIAEPLIDEHGHYSLDSLAKKYLGEHKEDAILYQWLADAYGGAPTRRAQGGNIYRAPVTMVAPYAMTDARLPLLIWEKQKAELDRDELWDIFKLESKLPRLLHAMRRRGVRIDIDKAKHLEGVLTEKINKLQGTIKGINVNASSDLVKYAAALGVTPPTTDKGNPSFTGKWVERHMPVVAQIRKSMKIRDTFLRGYIFEHAIDGRLHCQFNQLRGDEYGTVSGRFSSSTPNLQNIPARDDELAPLVRGLYVPDAGHDIWVRWDWSQIEYRLLVNYALGRGAADARDKYCSDPSTDFHIMAADITGLDRKPAKNMNFGLVYGMGLPTMAANMGRPVDEVEPMLNTYHSKFPFVKATYNHYSRIARRDGRIRTLLGRLARFGSFDEGYHKALNRLLQGGAADIMKKAMIDIHEAGLCDIVGAPQLTVHDELDISGQSKNKRHTEAFNEMRNIMQTCVELKIPLIAQMEHGPDWGHTK